MYLSKAADYAILTVAYLASQSPAGHRNMRSKSQMAKDLNLPREFLSQILQKMTRAGILVSERGVKGGYSLRKPPRETTFRDVIEAIDGPLRMVECLSEDFENCGRLSLCGPIIKTMGRIQSEIQTILDRQHFEGISIHPVERGTVSTR